MQMTVTLGSSMSQAMRTLKIQVHDPMPLQDVAELDAAISAVEESGMDIKVSA